MTKNVTATHLEEIFDVYGKIVDIDLPIVKRREWVPPVAGGGGV